MFFSDKVKLELSRVTSDNLFFLYVEARGIVNFARININRRFCLLQSECIEIVKLVERVVKASFKNISTLKIVNRRKNITSSSYSYILTVDLKREFEFLNGNFVNLDFKFIDILRYDKVKILQYLRGVYLACGSVSDPRKEYQLEFVVHDSVHLNILAYILSFYDFAFRHVMRGKHYVLYIKDINSVERFLKLLGSSNSIELINNVKKIKNIRNNVNREINCETANITKTMSASAKQIANINFLIECNFFSNLSEKIRETAIVRKSNPDMSLQEIAREIGGGVSRSCVNHRLNTINKIADKLKMDKLGNNDEN